MTNQTYTINVFSDESMHLKHQGNPMVIGSIWGEGSVTKNLKDKVSLLKLQHSIPKQREIKWTKISPSKVDYYKDLVNLFFEESGLNFRAVVVPKDGLRHKDFQQTEEDFYYKIQYVMISNLARKHKGADFKIYLDFKDTWSHLRAQKLKEYLEKSGKHSSEFNAQPVRSYESVPMQITDLLIGAVAHANSERKESSEAKRQIINLIEEKSGQKLNQKSPYGVDKFNIFTWDPS